jgi:predicted ribosomally synthesized peptide with nif11-like leader
MDNMKELYDKVAKDDMLQAKFAEIINNAETTGEEETSKKLIVFAKDAGYEVTMDEIKVYFKDLSEKQSGQLSDAELDMVAGGKGVFGALLSLAGLGIGCAFASIMAEITKDGCGKTLSKDLTLV